MVIGHRLPKFTLYLVWQILQVPIIVFAYHHDLGSWHYWNLYRNIFLGLRLIDYLLALLAINECICTDYHVIALGFEAWLGSQLTVLAVAINNSQYWSKGENISNAIYLISCILWMRLLSRPEHD